MTVNNVNALLAYGTGRADAAGSMSNEGAKGDFEQFMARVNGKADPIQAEVSAGSPLTSQTVVPASPVKQEIAANKTGVQEADHTCDKIQKDPEGNVAKDTGSGEKMGISDDVSEKLEKSGEELVEDIAEEMGMTPEEVEEAMSVLGLTAMQLFDTDNLKQLLLVLSGNTDELSLLTDAALYGNLQDLLGVIETSLEELQAELGLSEEELDALLKQMISEAEKSEAAEGTLMQETPEVNLEGMKDYTVSVQKDGETVQMKVTVDDESGNSSVQEAVTGTAKTQAADGEKMQHRNASADNGKEGSAGNAFLQMLETPAETSDVSETANVEYRSFQTEEIMNQIVEYMKINLKADTQTMELQLHPASLGTVNVQIMAKDGGLTAHFTTQNEAVRAVIETQLIQLKNQFEEQGIKVDAVEVTVANHAYGQQFSQDSENAGQEQAKAHKGRRQINLDQFEEEDDLGEMEDSERIAVEMMRASGSTVDYTA